MKFLNLKYFLLLGFIYFMMSCSSFNLGYTHGRAINSFILINKNDKFIGNRRIKYHLGHHGKTDLYNFLNKREYPDFIYEFEDDKKSQTLVLFYPKIDSAFVFKPFNRRYIGLILRKKRVITPYERVVYSKLVRSKCGQLYK
ncbi:hypothetical protein [Tenacibaculum finnmarkense]|uniref:hypothetical protein n=1 Tax=Tenacibaculum finnmarkense TaxID=2781243 RepID=UPI001E4A7027|nr:hypothetical protein [Tenacibaculum finnmarkense]MCD8402411.1 hypothetical protein [Tenacibaculum finnmarkense genomovar finnmarkense]MCD8446686.1 hypothetical protein [Tenacibaculum finnmarkense genomovar finnmarkense]